MSESIWFTRRLRFSGVYVLASAFLRSALELLLQVPVTPTEPPSRTNHSLVFFLYVRPPESQLPESLTSTHGLSTRSTCSRVSGLENNKGVGIWTQNFSHRLGPHLLALSGKAVVTLGSGTCLRDRPAGLYLDDISCPTSATCSRELRWGEARKPVCKFLPPKSFLLPCKLCHDELGPLKLWAKRIPFSSEVFLISNLDTVIRKMYLIHTGNLILVLPEVDPGAPSARN